MLFSFFIFDSDKILLLKQEKTLTRLKDLLQKHNELVVARDAESDLRTKVLLMRQVEKSFVQIKELIQKARKLKISDLEIEKLVKENLNFSID